MTRILADLPDEDIKWLDQLAAEQGKSRASVLREAVSAYRAEPSSMAWIREGAGAWKHRTDIGGFGRVAASRARFVDAPMG